MIGIGGFELTLVAVLSAVIVATIILLNRGRPARRGFNEIVIGAVVVLGAIIAPQAATVILLAMIYLQLMRRSRAG